MKRLFIMLALCSGICAPGIATARAQAQTKGTPNASLQNEVQVGIDRGLSWLKDHQHAEGFWSTEQHPALTALPLNAFHRDPSGAYKPGRHEFLQRGYAFVRSKAQPDGGIYSTGLSNYNTSLCLVALLNTGLPSDTELATRARSFIIAQQAKGMIPESLDGGIGYGPTGVSPKRQHPDLDNTVVSLEALRAYEAARASAETRPLDDLDWAAAIAFVSRTQNLPEHNPTASRAPSDRGGFVYYPGFSNADTADAPAALRSYGSMTYAGLLSFIFADLSKSDPRVEAALDWVRKNYTLQENPGLGGAGLFYYYHLLAKGLSAAGVEELELADGRRIRWPALLARRVLDLQQGDGSWVNSTGRWMEKDPVLVTSYCVLTLELIFQRL